MSTSFDLQRLFVPEHTVSTPEQVKQVQLFNQLLRSVLARCKEGQAWIQGIEYDTLMEHFVALQRSRVYLLAEENREVLLQDLINRRLNNTRTGSATGRRICRESVMVKSRRMVSVDDTFEDNDNSSEAALLLLRNGLQVENTPEQELGRKEEHLALQQAIASLKEREQQAVRLYMEGASYTQAGQALGVSDVYARKLLMGAFAKLRRVLEDTLE